MWQVPRHSDAFSSQSANVSESLFLYLLGFWLANLDRTPKEFMPCTCGLRECVFCRNTGPVNLGGALIRYQILEMKVGFPTARQFLIDQDAEDLREVESTVEGRKFRFPIAFAPDLQRISILRTLFWIERDGSLQKQRVDGPLFHPIPPIISAKKRSRRRRKRPKKDAAVTEQPQQVSAIRSRCYKLKFSPCGQYVAIVERQSDKNEFSEGHWNLTVWKESSDASAAQAHAWERVETLYDIYGDFLHEGNLAFHPRFQMIAFVEHAQYHQTSIWKFGAPTEGSCK